MSIPLLPANPIHTSFINGSLVYSICRRCIFYHLFPFRKAHLSWVKVKMPDSHILSVFSANGIHVTQFWSMKYKRSLLGCVWEWSFPHWESFVQGDHFFPSSSVMYVVRGHDIWSCCNHLTIMRPPTGGWKSHVLRIPQQKDGKTRGLGDITEWLGRFLNCMLSDL